MIRDGVYRKSTRSFMDSNCVEVAAGWLTVAMRDSRDPDGPVLHWSPQAWREFVDAVKEDELVR